MKRELGDLETKISRQLGHLEAESPDTASARTLRRRLKELGELKEKREQELASALRLVSEKPTVERASSLLEHLPVLDVSKVTLVDEEFRLLLQALRFEARYEANDKRLDVAVTLTPEIVLPSDREKVWVLSVPPVGFEPTL